MSREIYNKALRDAENATIYSIMLAFAVMLVVGGGLVYRLATIPRPPLVTFSDRWPDRDTLRDWEIQSILYKIRGNRVCAYDHKTQEYCT